MCSQLTLIPEDQHQVDVSTCSRCLFVILLSSAAEQKFPFQHPTHIVYAVYLFSTNTKEWYLYGGAETTCFQWLIMRLYSQINSFGPFGSIRRLQRESVTMAHQRTL